MPRFFDFFRTRTPASSSATAYPPVTLASLAAIAGVALQLAQPALWQQAAYVAACGAALLLLGAWLRCNQRAWCLCLALLLLGFGSTGWRAAHFARQQLAPALEGRDVLVEGSVIGLPQWFDDGARFTLAVEQATLNGEPVALPHKLALGWYVPRQWRKTAANAAHVADASADDSANKAAFGNTKNTPATCRICPTPGQRWRMTVRLKQPHGNRNPFGFDYELWLWGQGIGATGYVRNGRNDAPPQPLQAAPWHSSLAWLHRLRLQVRESIYQHLALPASAAAINSNDINDSNVNDGNDTSDTSTASIANSTAAPSSASFSAYAQRRAGVIAALVMGDQSAIERQDWDVFRITGVAHLMSISGLHITLFALLASGVLGWLWRQGTRWGARWGMPLCLWCPAPLVALWGGVFLAGAYALFSGWGVPAQRTVCMLAAVAWLRSGGRHWPWHAVLAVAAAVVLALDPWALLQAGFWLSFVAVAVLFATSGARQAPAGSLWQSLHQGTEGFIRQQRVVFLALSPLSLLLFGQISLIGLLANMLAVPLVTFGITPLAMLGVLHPALWHAADWLLQWLMVGLQWFAALPLAHYQAAIAPWWAGLAGIAGGLLLCLRLPWGLRLQGALWLLPLLLWQAPRPAAGQFDLLAADIGQGSAILVRTQRHSLLFDTGPQYSANSDAGQRVLLPLLAALDERPNHIILSHSDTDHIGGATSVASQHPQARLIGAIASTHPLHQQHTITPCLAGQSWQWDGVEFSFLHPLDDAYNGRTKTNSMSCVLRISNGQRTALLPGDIPAPQERAIIARQTALNQSLQADVLLVAHHGSKSSSSHDWLQAVQPQWALIQQGYRNRYQHPHPTVLQRLAHHGSTTLQSDQCGAIWWHSSANTAHCERHTHRRYWQHQTQAAN